MALIKCPECNHDVSSTALACPHCGFNVADHIRETERKNRELEQQRAQQRFLEEKEQKAEAKRKQKTAVRQYRSTHLKQDGNISFWIFAAQLLYAPVCAVLPYIEDYFIRKYHGILPADDTIVTWITRNWGYSLPMLTFACFTIFLIPSILYVAANKIKKVKPAKLCLRLGLMYHVAAFALLVVNIYEDLINGSGLAMALRFLIPLCFYLVLYYRATRIKVPPHEAAVD